LTVTDDPSTLKPRLSRRTGEALPPPELRALARERSEARRVQDWAEADRLRALIEDQGWKVVDKGAEGRVARAHPEDVIEADGVVRYGWTGAVPGFDEPRSESLVTIVARATPDAGDMVRLTSRLTDAPTSTHLLVVAGEHAAVPEDPSAMSDVEIVRIRGVATPGVLLAIALRRAAGEIVLVGEGWPAEATADRIPALIELLSDPTVGIAGWWGLVSSDLRRLEPADRTTDEPMAVAWAGMTFRTDDGRERGPVDEGFSDPGMLAAWWSLVLRDEGPEDAPRAARALLDATNAAVVTPGRDRAVRRDRYRIIDRFGHRYDLLTDPIAADRSRALRR
jgi:hypothetical protein